MATLKDLDLKTFPYCTGAFRVALIAGQIKRVIERDLRSFHLLTGTNRYKFRSPSNSWCEIEFRTEAAALEFIASYAEECHRLGIPEYLLELDGSSVKFLLTLLLFVS